MVIGFKIHNRPNIRAIIYILYPDIRIQANARCNEGLHHDAKENTPSLCIDYLGLNLHAFFLHLIAAAHQGNVTGVFRSGAAGAGFFHHQLKSAGIAMI